LTRAFLRESASNLSMLRFDSEQTSVQNVPSKCAGRREATRRLGRCSGFCQRLQCLLRSQLILRGVSTRLRVGKISSDDLLSDPDVDEIWLLNLRAEQLKFCK